MFETKFWPHLRLNQFHPFLTSKIELMLAFLVFLLLTERNRETVEELSAALREEKSRAEEIQLALANERRQTEALKHAKDRAEQLRNANKGEVNWLVG